MRSWTPGAHFAFETLGPADSPVGSLELVWILNPYLGKETQKMSKKMKKPSEEGKDDARAREAGPNRLKSETEGTVGPFHSSDLSESFTDPTSRGGTLGSEDEMPEGGDSTRFPEKDRSFELPPEAA